MKEIRALLDDIDEAYKTYRRDREPAPAAASPAPAAMPEPEESPEPAMGPEPADVAEYEPESGETTEDET